MLTRLQIRNFKQFDDVDIELGQSVVFIGPNNSGKTTALQALALWYVGLQKWSEKRSGQSSPEKRPGVAINRRDLISIPIPKANLLWRDIRTHSSKRNNGKTDTRPIRIDIIVEGITQDETWQCGLEFDYANDESFYCRPLRLSDEKSPDRMPVPDHAIDTQIAFLPPMSGLAAEEPFIQPGRINVLVGEGQTAQVLRNLCYQIYEQDRSQWKLLTDYIDRLFGARLLPPEYIEVRGEIRMAYQDAGRANAELSLSSSGRGMLQNLLLFAYLLSNPGSILLFDEPDAHLEILRQRQIYQLLTDAAKGQRSQVIAASHSEVLLNEAAQKDIVVAFVGQPHRIDSRSELSKVTKSLTDFGFEQYYQAQQKGWVLYLEGATDLAILQAFATALGHNGAVQVLESPFVKYVESNAPQLAREHFYAVKEAYPKLVGIALFDRLDKQLRGESELMEIMWRKREIESYLLTRETLLAYARQHDLRDDLFGRAEAQNRETIMNEEIDAIVSALATLGTDDPWSGEIKASDEFLKPLFERYFRRLELPNQMRKSNYHVLAVYVPVDEIDSEVSEKLDLINRVANQAIPYQS